MYGNGLIDMRLRPGDTVVIQDGTLLPTSLSGVSDRTQAFSQLALGAEIIDLLHCWIYSASALAYEQLQPGNLNSSFAIRYGSVTASNAVVSTSCDKSAAVKLKA